MNKDFIPEGEAVGPFGKNGFSDFVPAPEPRDVEIVDETVKGGKKAKKSKNSKKAKKVKKVVEAVKVEEPKLEKLEVETDKPVTGKTDNLK